MASNVSLDDSNSGNYVFQFKISLKYPKPLIWRRVLVPGDYTFKGLHFVIQNVMGWSNTHLHKFNFIDPMTHEEIEASRFNDIELNGMGTWWPESTKLNVVFKSVQDKVTYDYDFGFPWHHIILLEKILPADRTQRYPQCIAGKRSTPPEHDIPEETEGFDPELFDAKLVTFRKCRDFLQVDEEEVKEQDSSSEYDSDESIDFSYNQTIERNRESLRSEDKSDPEEFSTDPELAAIKTVTLTSK